MHLSCSEHDWIAPGAAGIVLLVFGTRSSAPFVSRLPQPCGESSRHVLSLSTSEFECFLVVSVSTFSTEKLGSQEEKIRRRKWIIQTLKRQKVVLGRIDRRTRMLAAGLRELFILGEDYVSMVACEDEVDVAILNALREAGATGRQSGELVVQLDVDHTDARLKTAPKPENKN